MPLFGPPRIDKLEARGDVKGLTKALSHVDAAVRSRAANALGHLGHASATEPLCVALADPDRGVREAAATSLGRLGDRHAVEPLISALRHTDNLVAVRGAAAEALGHLADRRAVEPLVACLGGAAPLRSAAIRALNELEWRPSSAEEAVAYCLATGDLRRCVDLGPDAVDPLLHRLRVASWRDRAAIAKALGAIGSAKAAEPLTETFEQSLDTGIGAADAESARLETIRALGAIGSKQAIEFLTRLLGHGRAEVQSAAFATLDELGPRALDSLVAQMESSPGWSRNQIALLLVAHGMRLDDPTLHDVLSDIQRSAAAPDRSTQGHDEDWRKIDDTDDGQRTRDAARVLGERLVALWASSGDVDVLGDLDIVAAESELVECLGFELDWHTKGRIALLLVDHGMSPDDPVVHPVVEELQAWKAMDDIQEELDAYLVKTTSYGPQRQAAEQLLAQLR